MGIIIFISYSRKDNEIYHVPSIASKLREYNDIEEVLYYEGADYNDIVTFMNDNLTRCDVVLLFWSKNAADSKYIKKEWEAAVMGNKKIIPIFLDLSSIPFLLKPNLGVKFQLNNIERSTKEIYNTINKAINAPDELIYEALEIKKIDRLNRFQLGWSKYFNDEIIQQIGFRTYKDIKEFLRNPDQWGDVINSISHLENADEWYENAFQSIQSGSKGLVNAHYLDHALISVPPPFILFKRISSLLLKKFVVGIEAPAGWGKSRLLLWVALSFSLRNKNIYYFPDPLELNDKKYQNSLQALLKKANQVVVIIDDFQLRKDTTEIVTFWRENIQIAKDNQNMIIFSQTRQAQLNLSYYNIDIIDSHEYMDYWRSILNEHFEIWFRALSNTILQEYIFFDEYTLDSISLQNNRDSISPWGLVSIIVNLRSLISKQLSIIERPNLVVLFTVLVWGFAASNERGLSPKEIFNALLWIRDNSQEDWELLEQTGGRFWEKVNINEKNQCLEELIIQFEEWRQSPHDLTEIRLLPSEGVQLGQNSPVKVHHIAWWDKALREMWDDEWKDLSSLKEVCRLIILHSSPIIQSYWLSIDKSCDILEGAQIKILDLSNQDISDITPLSSLHSLKKLYLSGTSITSLESLHELNRLKVLTFYNTKVTDINPLDSLTNLEELNFKQTDISDIKPLLSLKKLKKLDFSNTKVFDISPISSLTALQEISLGGKFKLSDLSVLASLLNLKKLDLADAIVTDLSWIASLSQIEFLDLSNTQVSDISPLKSLRNLKTLNLCNTLVSDIEPLKQLTNLRRLYLDKTKVSNIEILSHLKSLESLRLLNTKVTDINPLASLTNLEELWIGRRSDLLSEDQVFNLESLETLSRLKKLVLWDSDSNKEPLTSLSNLKSLTLFGASKFEMTLLKKKLKHCRIADLHLEINDFVYDQSNLKYEERQKLEEKLNDKSLQPSVKAEILFDIGEIDYRHWDYSQALKHFQESLTIYEQLKDPYWIDKCLKSIGSTYCALKNFKSACEIFKKVDLKIKNYFSKIHLILAEVSRTYFPLHFRYFLKWMKEQLTKADTNLTDVADKQIYLGEFYAAMEFFADAEIAYKKALKIFKKLDADNPGIHIHDVAKTQNELGNIYLNLNNLEKAERLFKKALDIYKDLSARDCDSYLDDFVKSLTDLRDLYLKDKRFGEAIHMYEESLNIGKMRVKQNPESFSSFLIYTQDNLGTLYHRTERYYQAEECYKEVLQAYEDSAKQNPENYNSKVIRILKNLRSLYVLLKKPVDKEVLGLLKKLVDLDPNDKISWYDLGINSFKIGNYIEAIECFDKALDIDPEFLDAWRMRGKSFFISNRIYEAELCYDIILKVDINDGDAWFTKARIESLRNNKDKAIECLKKAIELNDYSKIDLKYEDDFDNIKKSKEFKKLIKTLPEAELF
ncbi:MAG: tetratricopeptide repeat protein [Promethearchaeota archaeon]